MIPSLLAWWHAAKRDLPWRRTRDPYAILVSEVMCQQTRVDTVIPYYERFLSRLPTVRSLAEAPLEQVLALWSGLGYYRRARMLQEAARAVVTSHDGRVPDTAPLLLSLPGVGAYTAGAVASIAFGAREALVDGNVARVLSRLFAIEEDVSGGAGQKLVWEIARGLVPAEAPGEWNQALMELGALVCVPDKPGCLVCPLESECLARKRGVERELPRIGKKAKPSLVHRIAIVASTSGARGATLLGRRTLAGVFGGMWEPPSVDVLKAEELKPATDRAVAALFGNSESSPRGGRHVGTVKHVLSHRVMTVEVVKIVLQRRTPVASPSGEYDAVEYVLEAAMKQRGITTLARKIMAMARASEDAKE